jgi:hypothetical protein
MLYLPSDPFDSLPPEVIKMAASYVAMQDAIIPNGATKSNVFNSPLSFDDAESILLVAPAALDAGTYTIEVNANPKALTTDAGWGTLQIGDPAADAAPPAITKARVYYELACVGSWRLAGPAAAADRTFKVGKSIYL